MPNTITEDELYDMSDEELEALRKQTAEQEVDVEPSTEVQPEPSADEQGEVVQQESVEENNVDLEQPIENEDSKETIETDNPTQELENKIDEQQKEPVEQTQEQEEQPEKSEQQLSSKRKFKAVGKEFEFTDDEILQQFPTVFAQAMDYRRKTQAIAPWRKTIDAIETAGLSHDDINLAIDVLKGNKDAITEVLKKHEIDTMAIDPDTHQGYKPNDYGRDPSVIEVENTIKELSEDPDFMKTEKVLGQEWDDKSMQEIYQNPEYIRYIHEDIKNGVYDRLAPEAQKLKVFDGGRKSDIEYYQEAVRLDALRAQEQQLKITAEESIRKQEEAQRAEQERIAKIKAAEEARRREQELDEKRKAATINTQASNGSKVTDYLDALDDDEGFKAFYAKAMGINLE